MIIARRNRKRHIILKSRRALYLIYEVVLGHVLCVRLEIRVEKKDMKALMRHSSVMTFFGIFSNAIIEKMNTTLVLFRSEETVSFKDIYV